MAKVDFSLRALKMDDADSIAKYANNMKVSENLKERFPFPYNKKNAVEFIESVSKTNNAIIFAIVVNDEAVGAIGLHLQMDIYKKTVELGYWLGEDFWNKGIMSSAVKEVLAYTKRNLNVIKIFAKVFECNHASAKVLEKNGFLLEARLKKQIYKNNFVMDELIYAKYFS